MADLCGDHEMVVAGLGRENLCLAVQTVQREEERWLLLVAALRNLRAPDSALVYCASRAEADESACWLRSAGLPAVSYHAGHPASWRSARSRAFREGHLRVICATSAFGMGIDYPHVQIVVHFSLPYDLESYWQEVGRAGRSGKTAYGLAFWRRSEIARAWRLNGESRERFVALWRAWAQGGCRMLAVAKCLQMTEAECGRCDECCRERCVSSVPPLIAPLPVAWWMRPEAQLAQWLEKIISHSAKNLDGF
jgi:ATP-dependent DNA helicase RecQ